MGGVVGEFDIGKLFSLFDIDTALDGETAGSDDTVSVG